jgi:hypothetical protein
MAHLGSQGRVPAGPVSGAWRPAINPHRSWGEPAILQGGVALQVPPLLCRRGHHGGSQRPPVGHQMTGPRRITDRSRLKGRRSKVARTRILSGNLHRGRSCDGTERRAHRRRARAASNRDTVVLTAGLTTSRSNRCSNLSCFALRRRAEVRRRASARRLRFLYER